MALLSGLGRRVLGALGEMGGIALFFARSVTALFRPPYRWRNFLRQMEFIGARSTTVVLLTGLFTGMVLALQGYYGFRKFGGESLLGATVALSMTRELGPVLTALMVTARAGSAMAAEIGTMRVTEQIDALAAMAVDPFHYLVVPRVWAAFLMLPLLTGISNAIGIVGGHLVGVELLGIDPGIYVKRMEETVVLGDITNGLYKSAVFGILLALIGCYKGYHAEKGARGVGRATTGAVVLSSISILVGDYILTSLLF
nr:ABC transporter permease [Dissulfurirhabdus thermomarina]